MSWRLERPGDSWLAAEGTITSGGLPRDPSVCVCVCAGGSWGRWDRRAAWEQAACLSPAPKGSTLGV